MQLYRCDDVCMKKLICIISYKSQKKNTSGEAREHSLSNARGTTTCKEKEKPKKYGANAPHLPHILAGIVVVVVRAWAVEWGGGTLAVALGSARALSFTTRIWIKV